MMSLRETMIVAGLGVVLALCGGSLAARADDVPAPTDCSATLAVTATYFPQPGSAAGATTYFATGPQHLAAANGATWDGTRQAFVRDGQIILQINVYPQLNPSGRTATTLCDHLTFSRISYAPSALKLSPTTGVTISVDASYCDNLYPTTQPKIQTTTCSGTLGVAGGIGTFFGAGPPPIAASQAQSPVGLLVASGRQRNSRLPLDSPVVGLAVALFVGMIVIRRLGGVFPLRHRRQPPWLVGLGFGLVVILGLWLSPPSAQAADYNCTASFSGAAPRNGSTYSSISDFLTAWDAAIRNAQQSDTGGCGLAGDSVSFGAGTASFTINGQTFGYLTTASIGSGGGTISSASYTASICHSGTGYPAGGFCQPGGSISGGPYYIQAQTAASGGNPSGGGGGGSSTGSSGAGAPVGSVAVSAQCTSADIIASVTDCTIHQGDSATIHYTSQDTGGHPVWIQVSGQLSNLGQVDGDYATGAISQDTSYIFTACNSVCTSSSDYVWSNWVTVHVIAPLPPAATTGRIAVGPSDNLCQGQVSVGATVFANGGWVLKETGNYTGTIFSAGDTGISGTFLNLVLYKTSPQTDAVLTLESASGIQLDTKTITITSTNCPVATLTVNGQHTTGRSPLIVPGDSTLTLAWDIANQRSCTAQTVTMTNFYGVDSGAPQLWSGTINPQPGQQKIDHVTARVDGGVTFNEYQFSLNCISLSGYSNGDLVYVQIQPVTPVVACTANPATPTADTQGQAATQLTASLTNQLEPGVSVSRYQWDFGDNSPQVGLAQPVQSADRQLPRAATIHTRANSGFALASAQSKESGDNRLVPSVRAATTTSSPAADLPAGLDALATAIVQTDAYGNSTADPPVTTENNPLNYKVSFKNTGSLAWDSTNFQRTAWLSGNFAYYVAQMTVDNVPVAWTTAIAADIKPGATMTAFISSPANLAVGIHQVSFQMVRKTYLNNQFVYTPFGSVAGGYQLTVKTLADFYGEAATVTINASSTMSASIGYPVTITAKNTGSRTWQPYQAVLYYTFDTPETAVTDLNSRAYFYSAPITAAVKPGETATFHVNELVGASGTFYLGAVMTDRISDSANGFSGQVVTVGSADMPVTVVRGPVATVSHTYSKTGIFTVTVTATDSLGATGSGTCQVTVASAPLPAAPRVSLTPSVTSIVPGDSLQLTWTSTNATSVTKTVGFTTSLVNGSTTLTPTIGPTDTSLTFSITVHGPGGDATDTKTVAVKPVAPSASPPSVSSFQGAFAAGTIQINRTSPLDIIYDPTVQKNPPPGFAQIIPPQTSEH